MIHISKPFLPPKEEYDEYVKEIWCRNWITNHGPLVNNFELKLKDYLGVPHLLFVTNGTIALQVAYKALDISSEVITTPFSYVATTSSLVWENCTPVFVDIDPQTLNIDPDKIESAISEKTTAIVATHVYGNPCDIERLEDIAKRNNLKLIFDAAHCFGVKYKGESVLNYGDISILSFHATKMFHTIEGGAVITKSPALLKKMSYLRNFGHEGAEAFNGLGINGKNCEFHAAMGLCNLTYANKIKLKYETNYKQYRYWLEGKGLTFQCIDKKVDYNYAYFPVLFDSEDKLKRVKQVLEQYQIFPRRYFYPLLTNLDYVPRYDCPVAEDVSRRILCLPMFYGLIEEDIDMICRLIIRTLKYA